MASTKHKLSDEEIMVRVNQKSKESVGWYDSKLSKERERVLQYYNSELPKRQDIGSSSYISTDVYDGVEAMKAQILETFAGGDEIATFDPDQDMGVKDCLVATKYASYVIFSQNDGYGVFRSIIHDGLTARVGVAKVWWEEKHDETEETFEDLPLDQVYALSAQEDVSDMKAEMDEEKGLFAGSLKRKVDRSQCRILAMPPEEFLIAPRSITIPRAPYCSHRTLKSKAELLEMGLDAKKVEDIHYDDSRGLDLSPEVLARNAPVETSQALNNPIQPDMELVMLYESYVRMKIEPSRGVRLYKVTHASDTLFDYEEVDKAPFIPFVALPIPHCFYGNNFAARIVPTQNARTVLTRAVLDHATMTTNPRWQVVNGGLMNPREMLDNRKGGLVNVRRPDTVSALQVPNLNPFVFEVLKNLEDDNEKSTGISALSQGLNKDAISKQNSGALVDQLVTLSQQRQKIVARNFAYDFFVPLLLEVIRLVIMNEKKSKVVEVAGDQLQVTPEQWTERTTCTVAMHLGYGEKVQAVQKHNEAYKQLASDPSLANMFGPEQRWTLATDTMKLAGLKNSAAYLLHPKDAPPIQPDPMKTRELDIRDKLAQAALITAQSHTSKDQRMAGMDAAKLGIDQANLHLDTMTADRQENRKDLEVAARIDIANREMELQEQMPDTSRKAVVAPNP